MAEAQNAWVRNDANSGTEFDVWVRFLSDPRLVKSAAAVAVEVNAGRSSYVRLAEIGWDDTSSPQRVAREAFEMVTADNRRTGRKRYRLQLYGKNEKPLECAALIFGGEQDDDASFSEKLQKLTYDMVKDGRTHILKLEEGSVVSHQQAAMSHMLASELMHDNLKVSKELHDREMRLQTRPTPADTNFRIAVMAETIKGPLWFIARELSPSVAEFVRGYWSEMRRRQEEQQRERHKEQQGGFRRPQPPPGPSGATAQGPAPGPSRPRRVPDRVKAMRWWSSLTADNRAKVRERIGIDKWEAIQELFEEIDESRWAEEAIYLPDVLIEHRQSLNQILDPNQQLLLMELLQ